MTIEVVKEETIEDHQEIIENQEKTGIITILLKTKSHYNYKG
jgi:hypothetical protein